MHALEHGQKRVHATIPVDNTLCDISIYAENICAVVITVIPRYNRISRVEILTDVVTFTIDLSESSYIFQVT